MRLGRDVLEADLYGDLGLLPDATESEIRLAYRRMARASHPDLNQHDRGAVSRMARLNIAARVLLDPALRRAYDRNRTWGNPAADAPKPARRAAWFEHSERSGDSDWTTPTVEPGEPRERRASFGNFFAELRSRDGQLSLQVQEAIESLSVRQQLGVAALLFAVAIGLIAWAQPANALGDVAQPTSVDVRSVYP
jgi:DnaJ-class molecular chaperone